MSLRAIIHTPDDRLLALLRAVLGFVYLAHGAQKVLGWFGGPGFESAMSMFTQNMGIPWVFALLAILAEFLGGIGLLIGLLSRIAAAGIAIEMVVAVLLVHARNGLFMNWTGSQAGEGFEYHLLAISIALLVAVRGAGAWSLDRALDAWLTGGHTFHIHMEPQTSR